MADRWSSNLPPGENFQRLRNFETRTLLEKQSTLDDRMDVRKVHVSTMYQTKDQFFKGLRLRKPMPKRTERRSQSEIRVSLSDPWVGSGSASEQFRPATIDRLLTTWNQ